MQVMMKKIQFSVKFGRECLPMDLVNGNAPALMIISFAGNASCIETKFAVMKEGTVASNLWQESNTAMMICYWRSTPGLGMHSHMWDSDLACGVQVFDILIRGHSKTLFYKCIRLSQRNFFYILLSLCSQVTRMHCAECLHKSIL